jgi:hypothetical protein
VAGNYGPLAGTFPSNPDVPFDANPPSPDPDTCANLTSCDVIPLTVTQPASLSVFDEVALVIEARWESGSAVDNDLNLYLWYDPSTGNPGGSATTHKNPEVLRFGEPVNGRYNLVVANAAGANTGYSLKVHLLHVHNERPAELDPPSSPARSTPASGSTPAPAPPPPRSPATAPVTPLIVATGDAPLGVTPLTPVPTGADPDLAGLDAAGAQAAGGGSLFKEAPGASGPPKPVPAPVLLFWTVLVPLAVMGGSGFLFLRFRPRALTVRPPVRPETKATT